MVGDAIDEQLSLLKPIWINCCDAKHNGIISDKKIDFLASLAMVSKCMNTCLHVRGVPPDSNECERDIHRGKVKSKVSGQWQSAKEITDCYKTRNLITTTIKQGLRPIEAMPETQQVALVAK